MSRSVYFCPLLLAALFAGACTVDGEIDEHELQPADAQQAKPELSEEAEVFNSEDYRAFLLRSAQQWPDAREYEHIGFLKPANSDIWIHDEEPAASLQELLSDRKLVKPEGDEQDASQGILVAADGRVFLERAEHFRERLARIHRMPAAGQSAPAERSKGTEPDEIAHTLDNIEGNDNRTPVTSSSHPTRAVGVSLLRQSGSNWIRGTGSASMVSPRAALTAAHVISSNGSSFNTIGVAPAARGYSYCDGSGFNNVSTCKFPYGLRWVQWYYWPSSWDGGGAKFDYGVLILDDQAWSPGYVLFGYQTLHWLNYRQMDHAGYPSPSKNCDNAIDADGECGGYMYRQTADTNAVYTNYAYYDFDVQEGQSGAPIYDITGGSGAASRVVYILHKGSSAGLSYGKRLRSGSFDTICNWIGNWPSSHFGNPSC